MSLNWVEIDQVIQELALEGAFLQNVRQSDWHHFFFEFYKPGKEIPVLVSLSPGKLRLHQVSKRPPNLAKTPRFAAFLRAHLVGAQVLEIQQLGQERVVFLKLVKSQTTFFLWIRLWNGAAANILVTDVQGVILEVAFRRPASGQIKGGIFRPEEQHFPLSRPEKPTVYALRELGGEGNYSQRLETFYHTDDSQNIEKWRSEALRLVEKKLNFVQLNRAKTAQKLTEYQRQDDWKFYGDLLMANLWCLQKGATTFEAEDWRDGNKIVLSLNPQLSIHENAQVFYRKYQKAKAGLKVALADCVHWDQEEQLWKSYQTSLLQADLETIKNFLSNQKKPRQQSLTVNKDKKPGLEFLSGGFVLSVGRNARENDELLRHWVKGNDIWLHTRDIPGGFVFIRTMKGKTIPLETLIDAGNLTILYSKAKTQGRAEVHYTSVKYLRRVKDKMGLVLPTQEKNLSVVFEKERINQLHKVMAS